MASIAAAIISPSFPSTSPKLNNKPSFSSTPRIQKVPSLSLSLTLHSYNLSLLSHNPTSKRHQLFQLRSTAETLIVEEENVKEDEEKAQVKVEIRKKLFVLNLPWSYSVSDIKKLFGEAGIVSDVEIIKQKDGKNRGFAFVTMETGEEAQAAIEKFDSFEVAGRIIRVQFSRRFKKPIRTIPPVAPPGDARHKLYVSNLAWKARSNNLREIFTADFNPVSVRVVFDSPEKSAGYGFVSFATKEEAETAISALDGKELMGRPIRLKFSERNTEATESKEEPSPQPPSEES